MRRGRKQAIGIVLVVAGVVVVGVGVAGQLGSWGAKTMHEVAAPRARSGDSSTTTTTTIVPAEDPAQFLGELGTALRAGDTNFLVGRLNPAVIARYGSGQCLGALAGARDASAQFTVKQVTGPTDFGWTTDAKTVRITNALSVEVDRTQRGVVTPVTVHLAPVGHQLTWFIDCGTPVGP